MRRSLHVILLAVLLSSSTMAATITVPTDQPTVHAAVAASLPGDVVYVLNGTYTFGTTLNIDKAITLRGESRAGVVFDIDTGAGYGVHPSVGGIVMEDFTLNVITSTGTEQGYVVHASGTPDVQVGLEVRRVTIQGSGSGTVVKRRAGLDIHGYDSVVVSDVTSMDATWGNGIQITGCSNVTVDNVVTMNNAWGSLAVYVSQYIVPGPRPSTFVTIDGPSCSFGEGVVFLEDGYGAFSTNIVVTGAEYYVRNTDYRAGGELFMFFLDSLADARAFATVAFAGFEDATSFQSIATGNFLVEPGMSIQAAIDAASAGDTVDLAAGTFTATAQIVVDKDLTIVGAGAGATTIVPGFDTTVGYYLISDALMFVDYGVTATIENLSIDGTGRTVRHAIQSRGTHAVVRGCDIANIFAGTYAGRGVVFLTGTGLVENCTMSGIQRIGVHIRGAVEPTAPDVVVDGLEYAGKGVGDWLDYGVEFGGGGKGSVTNSVIGGCEGVAAVDGSTSAAVLVTDYYGTGTVAAVTDTDLSGNTYGAAVGYAAGDLSVASFQGCDLSGNTDYGIDSTGPLVQAQGNWWGAASGPHHVVANPFGGGVEVGDNVEFDPWTGMGTVSALPAASGPINCGETVTLTVGFTPDVMTPALRGYTVRLVPSAELSFGAGDIVISDTLDLLGGDFPQILDNGDGSFTVDNTILGPTPGLATAGDLFTVTVHPVTDGAGTVDLADVVLRDLTNGDIGALTAGSAITVDCTAPPAATDLATATGHELVDLTWTMADASDVDHYEIWRALWHTGDGSTSAHPEYDDVNPAEPVWPADRAAADASAEWTLVDAAVAGSAVSYTDAFAARGVYYYEVFAVDAAGNVGAGHGPFNRATNYFLGDVETPFDGEVLVGDITQLGSAYGTVDGDGLYDAEVDVGPTDDRSGLGIPTTDSAVGFEDLMIFALNYNTVAKSGHDMVAAVASFAWRQIDDRTWSLDLNEACEGLRGVNVRAQLPDGVSSVVRAGDMLALQSGPTFVGNVERNGLDAGLAIFGDDFAGPGQLIVVELSAPAELRPMIEARGSDNSVIEATMATGASDLPTTFALHRNHPNPFNPSTTIAFDLPAAGRVKLAVYDLDGSLVRTLVDGTVTAGRHEVIWNGRDGSGRRVASGAYFYRIESDAGMLIRKMLMVK